MGTLHDDVGTLARAMVKGLRGALRWAKRARAVLMGQRGKGRGDRAEGGAEGAMTLGEGTRLRAMRTGTTNRCSDERVFGCQKG